MVFFQFFFQMVWKISVEVFCFAVILGPVANHKNLQKIAGEFGAIAIILVAVLFGIWLSCVVAESMNKTWRQRHKRSYMDFML